jgi:lipopolysaccharide transport system ATP-binding protein
MKDVTSDGRTVVFVSHNMTTVTSLCSRCVLLDKGQVRAFDDARTIAELYFSGQGGGASSALTFPSVAARPGDDVARLCAARLVNGKSEAVDDIHRGQQIGVEMTFEVLTGGYRLMPNFHVFLQDQYAFVSSPAQNEVFAPGTYRSTMWIPSNFLNEGLYVVGVALTSMDPIVVRYYEQDALRFHVLESETDSLRKDYALAIPGIVRPSLDWNLVQENKITLGSAFSSIS